MMMTLLLRASWPRRWKRRPGLGNRRNNEIVPCPTRLRARLFVLAFELRSG